MTSPTVALITCKNLKTASVLDDTAVGGHAMLVRITIGTTVMHRFLSDLAKRGLQIEEDSSLATAATTAFCIVAPTPPAQCRYALRRRPCPSSSNETFPCVGVTAASSGSYPSDDARCCEVKSDGGPSKRSRLGVSCAVSTLRSRQGSAEPDSLRLSILDLLPDEILFRIFSYLLEGDLCRVMSVSRTFYRIANDTLICSVNKKPILEPSFESLSSSITEFTYDPESGETFPAWYVRFEDVFRVDGKMLDDAARMRLLLRKVATPIHKQYVDFILPHHPHDVSFKETVQILSSMFGPQTSLFNVHYKCLKMKEEDREDFIAMTMTEE
ncbi:unnamed protein product [Soboliphyme baturini]|uniref:F-box domain-containing protein n=1 Tax=Soboliphyme baturini TaxID=241478 RepID=A0A183ITK5_9BILA|nr:unnamed protein product [Soboliphyme baturini]